MSYYSSSAARESHRGHTRSIYINFEQVKKMEISLKMDEFDGRPVSSGIMAVTLMPHVQVSSSVWHVKRRAIVLMASSGWRE